MTSLSLAKFKSYLTLGALDNGQSNYRSKSAKYAPHDNLVPEVGFQLTLDPGNCNEYRRSIGTTHYDDGHKEAVHRVPELIVRVNGARHLPSNFGIKSVQGYVVKVFNIFKCITVLIFRLIFIICVGEIISRVVKIRHKHSNMFVANVQ